MVHLDFDIDPQSTNEVRLTVEEGIVDSEIVAFCEGMCFGVNFRGVSAKNVANTCKIQVVVV